MSDPVIHVSENEHEYHIESETNVHKVHVETDETYKAQVQSSEDIINVLHVESDEILNATVSSKIVAGDAEIYDGPYDVTPKAHDETKLQTKHKLMEQDVTVLEIPYYETSNISGTTVFIAGEVEIHGN